MQVVENQKKSDPYYNDVVAYTRDDLDEQLERKATEDEWRFVCDFLHEYDHMWSEIQSASVEAVSAVMQRGL